MRYPDASYVRRVVEDWGSEIWVGNETRESRAGFCYKGCPIEIIVPWGIERKMGKDREKERQIVRLQTELLSYFHSWRTGESSRDVWNPVNGHYCSYRDACNNYGPEDPRFATDSAPLIVARDCAMKTAIENRSLSNSTTLPTSISHY